MILKYREDDEITESIVDIVSVPNDLEIKKVLEVLDAKSQRLIVRKGRTTHMLEMSQIYYIEVVDADTFIYTEKNVYESQLKLYEFEELMDCLVRINKSTIVNLLVVETIKPDFGSRLLLSLDNKDQLMVNRAYLKEFKRKINMR